MCEQTMLQPLAALARGGRAVWFSILSVAAIGCGRDAESAAHSARIASLEDEVRGLRESVAALKTGQAPKPQAPPTAAGQNKPFSIECLQPWLLHTPLGATLWTCRSATPTPEGYYPQCSITVQPQVAIETRGYFEFAWNASPALREVKNVKDKPTKIKDRDGFEAYYEADPKSVPVKMRSVLIPDAEQVYAVTCFAPSNAFDKYNDQAFQKIIDTITFKKP